MGKLNHFKEFADSNVSLIQPLPLWKKRPAIGSPAIRGGI
jgi:hypothetical protein